MNCQMKLFMTLRCILKTKPQQIHFPAANRNSTDSSYSHCCPQGVKLGFLAPFNDKILFNAKSFHNLTQKRTEDVNRKNSQHKLSYRYFFRNVKLEKKKTTQPNVNTDYDSEEDVADYSDDDFSQFEEDYDAPMNYKTKEIMLKSLRADSILANGLGTSRSSMDKAFYDSKIRVNGEVLLKKSLKVDEEDYIDLIVGHEEEQYIVKRVRILKVLNERTSTDKQKLLVRVWKSAFNIDK